MAKPKEERFTLRIDAELLQAAKAKAEREDMPVSQVVRRLLRAWLAEDAPKPKSAEGDK